jgi:hypothetical protein
MNSDDEFRRWFANEVETTNSRPIAVVWSQALDGDIDIEEAAKQRHGLESEEEITVHRRLYRPQSPLEVRRQLHDIMAAARPASHRYRPWIVPLVACAAALLLVFLPPRRPQTPLPSYGAPQFGSGVTETRGEPQPPSDPVHHRRKDRVQWGLTAISDDSAPEAEAASLHVYAITAARQLRELDMQIGRQASGSFTIAADSLEAALGPELSAADVAHITFVVARPGVHLPTSADEIEGCQSTPEITCHHITIILR